MKTPGRQPGGFSFVAHEGAMKAIVARGTRDENDKSDGRGSAKRQATANYFFTFAVCIFSKMRLRISNPAW